MAKPIRKKLFVDRKLQGALLKRIVIYWACCLLFITVPLLIGKSFEDPEQILAVNVALDPHSHGTIVRVAARVTSGLVRSAPAFGHVFD